MGLALLAGAVMATTACSAGTVDGSAVAEPSGGAGGAESPATGGAAGTPASNVYAWGYGAADLTNFVSASTPTRLAGPGTVIKAQVASYVGCALTADGAVWQWGEYPGHPVVDSAVPDPNTMVEVPSITGATDVTCSGRATMAAVTADGALWIWASRDPILFPDGDVVDPVKVDGLPPVASAAITQGAFFAVTVDGDVYSWGQNLEGLLGRGRTDQTMSMAPERIEGLRGIESVRTTGLGGVVALTSDGRVYTWGSGRAGALNDTPQVVEGMGRVVDVAGGTAAAYALDDSGQVYAWGLNLDGALGDGSTTDAFGPVRVASLADVVDIGASANGYALTSDGRLWSWGPGEDGLLGNGTTVRSLVPTPVTLPVPVHALGEGSVYLSQPAGGG